MASGNAGNFQSVPVLAPDQVPIPTTRGSVNLYINTEDSLKLYSVDTFKVHRPVSSGSGDTFESGTFTRTAAAGSGVQTVTTVKKAKLIFFNAVNTNDNLVFSQGTDNVSNSSSGNQSNFDSANSISVISFPNGYTAKVTAINNNNYDVTWVQQAAGLDVTVQWWAITG